MSGFRDLAWSSVGKKLLTGITGFLLMGYIVLHLLGNLTLLIGSEAFNKYAHFLEGLAFGKFVYVFEIGLLIVLGVHLVAAVTVAITDKLRARPTGYAKKKDAGGTSRMTLSSKTMIYTGILLGVFIVWHVKSFKFGGAAMIPSGHGGEIKDLYTVVDTAFGRPVIVAIYVAMMILLGFHLRHGFWSAFQSLGWTNAKHLRTLERLALVLAWLIALGFIILPLIMYFGGDPSAAHAGGVR